MIPAQRQFIITRVSQLLFITAAPIWLNFRFTGYFLTMAGFLQEKAPGQKTSGASGSDHIKKQQAMSRNYSYFRQLHHQEQPLLIGNVWNVQSAKAFEALGLKAIATSSAAIAETLGYDDGEQMNFDEYLFVIRHISRLVTVPLSVDLEAGYGATADQIIENITKLAQLGICGINIEDSLVENGRRTIADANVFARKLQDITGKMKTAGIEMFVNVRSDTFLLGLPDPVQVSMKRIALYEKTGIDGLFFPCVTQLKDIAAITSATSLPVNVMCMPGLPSFDELKKAGVKRISMGNFLNKKIYTTLSDEVQAILQGANFSSLFDRN